MAADPGQLSWKCYDCNMTFGNPTLLQKHKSRFCVGGQLGDPELLLLRRGFRDEEPPPARDPPEDPDQPRYNPHADPKVQQLAESHGRQMEFLQNRNRDLERQREEIRRRLEELGRRPVEKDNSTEELLRELREQEARNQRLLDELKQQLMQARRPINIIRQEAQPEKKSFIYPVYYGNSLVAEIVAVRQAYLQNGGNDPDILAQLAQMQAEAQAIDDSMRNAQKKQPKERKDGLPPHLLTMEMENERLQRQLLLLQEQKLISTNRRKDNREGNPPRATRKPPNTRQPPNSQQTLTKWVQTNPVPSEDAESSALPVSHDYASHRQQARREMEDRWGQGRGDTPPPQPGLDPQNSASKKNEQSRMGIDNPTNTEPGGRKEHGTQRPPRQTDAAVESLKPDRELETIEEAANVDDYDAEQPLDVNLAAIPPLRRNRVLFPHKPNIDQPATSRSVVVRSERPYGWVDFYGREVDEKGRLKNEREVDGKGRLKNEREGVGQPIKWSTKQKENRFPYYKTNMTGQKLTLYDHLLRDMFTRSEDLIGYDPYYHSIYRKRRRYATEPEPRSGYTPRQPTNPHLVLNESRVRDNSDRLELESVKDHELPGTSRTTNAEAQTDLRDVLEGPNWAAHDRGMPFAPQTQNPSQKDTGQAGSKGTGKGKK